MISQTQLLSYLTERYSKAFMVELAGKLHEQHFPLKVIVDLTFHPDDRAAFRASWLLEILIKNYAASYVEELPYIFENVPRIVYASNQRHYANITHMLTSPKAPASIKSKVDNIDMQPVIEKLFDWLIDPQVLVAVKASAAEALLYLAPAHDWIAAELAEQLHFLMKNGTTAIQARGNMILKKLASQ